MSFDLRFDAVCDHRTHLEAHVAEQDRRTVLLPQPVVQTAFVVRMNGYVIPTDHPIYGWNLVQDPNGATPDFMMLKFKQKLKAYDDYFQLSYQTAESNCRRCHGRRIYRDISLDMAGRLRLVVDENKLLQDLFKGMLTIRGTNQYETWYGTSLVTLIGTKVVNEGILSMRLQREAAQFLDNFSRLQLRQSQIQKTTLREMILQVSSVDAAAVDPQGSQWELTVTVVNRAGNEVSFVSTLDVYNTAFVLGTKNPGSQSSIGI